ncbi:lipoate--protein ligase family protein [Bifidobacterium subtile]|jgi:lipoate-protein ligase A|uniref:Ligase n=1 Tax=Bifidobacterium subtile TaxID=77635 RepID=A0A087EAC9_9BIFI|nr:lipoate--protein ligase family protein [Bifidobacterium subtile]KFJ04730.1 ligase [Bifidobacterium subtile]QOL35812.1 lipoate--protein ligase family protein [Bifidobacterium subtile]
MQVSDDHSARGGFSRGECKLAGGKLVGVNVRRDGTGAVAQCRLDGDFFLDGADDREIAALVHDIERALVEGVRIEAVFARHAGTSIVGVDAASIETAFARAVGAGTNTASDGLAGGQAGETDIRAQSSQAQERQTRGARTDKTRSYAAASVPSPTPLPPAIVGSDALRDEARRRWADLRPVVVHDRARQPQDQMDVDEQWAREVAAGTRPATLRIWEWASSAVIIGRFQSLEDSVDLEACRREQVSVVRRCTGGGAMFVEPGNTITYSLYAPRDFVRDVSIEQSYRLCDQWLVDALDGIGLDVRFSGLNDIASQYGKIGGAAQRRFPPQGAGPGSLLHHVTMSYDIDAAKMGRVLKVSREKLRDKAVRSAVRRVDPLRSQTGMDRASIIALLTESARDGSTMGLSR